MTISDASVVDVQGIPGDPGSRGLPGKPGLDGQHGMKGDSGMKGEKGIDGGPGQIGKKTVPPYLTSMIYIVHVCTYIFQWYELVQCLKYAT